MDKNERQKNIEHDNLKKIQDRINAINKQSDKLNDTLITIRRNQTEILSIEQQQTKQKVRKHKLHSIRGIRR